MLIGLLILLIVACVVIWGAQKILAAFGIGDPIATVVYVFLVIVFLILFVNQFGYGPNLGLRFR